MTTVLYILASLGTVVVVSWLYSRFVPESGDRVPDSIAGGGRNEFDPLDVVRAQTTSPVASRNEIEMFVNGDEIFPPMLEAIRTAQETIEFLTFVYWTGDIAEEFAGALADAAQRGVAVRVLLDAFGALKMSDGLVDRMEDAGCDVAWYRPLDWYSIQRLNNRTHRKVLVADRRVAFTGGVGIAEEWTGDARNPDHWRDNHFRVRGPAVRHLHAAFTENWRRATGVVMIDPIPEDDLEGRGSALTVPLATSPRGRASDIGVMVWLLLVRAEASVDLATPYFLPDETLISAIADTAKRGVRVRLLVPGPHLDKQVVRWASNRTFPRLIDAGVEVWEFQPTMMHAKTIVVDRRWSMIGSANLDSRSIDLNDELVLLVDEEELAERITGAFEADLARSKRLTPDTLRRIRPHQRAIAWAGLLLREHL